MAVQWKQSESERAQEMGGWDILSSCDFSHQRTASELVPEESLVCFIIFLSQSTDFYCYGKISKLIWP